MGHQGERAYGKQELGALARGIVDSNLYATLATADAEGRPRASPVWFAHEGYRDFLWVSRPEARHSRNLAVRPELALVVVSRSSYGSVSPGSNRGSTASLNSRKAYRSACFV